METEEAIRTRRSVRAFAQECVGDEDLEAILEAGRWAPSGLNNQPWRLVIVRDREKARGLASLTKYSSTVENAPLLIAVFLDHGSSYHREKDIMAVGAFIQNMLLAAHSRGLGGVWLGEILKNKEAVREMLEVPQRCELMALVALGYPAAPAAASSRKTMEELVLKRF